MYSIAIFRLSAASTFVYPSLMTLLSNRTSSSAPKAKKKLKSTTITKEHFSRKMKSHFRSICHSASGSQWMVVAQQMGSKKTIAQLRQQNAHCFPIDSCPPLVAPDSVLAHYDPSKPLLLACNASLYGMGALVLYSHTSSIMAPNDRPIAYASRSHGPVAKKYSYTSSCAAYQQSRNLFTVSPIQPREWLECP